MNEWLRIRKVPSFSNLLVLFTFSPPHVVHPSCQEWEAEVIFLRPRCCSVLCQYPTHGSFSFKGLTLRLKTQNLLTWIKKEIGVKDYLYLTTYLHIGLTTATTWQGYLGDLICWAFFVRCTTGNNAAAWARQRNDRAKPGHFQSFSHLPRIFFYLLSDYFVLLCVRSSVRNAGWNPCCVYLSISLFVNQFACLRACLYAVWNSINAGHIFTWFDAG